MRIQQLPEPLHHIVQSLGNAYIFAERFDDAIEQGEKLLEIDPLMRTGIELKAWSLGLKGDWTTSMQLFKEVHRLTNHPLKGLMGLGYAYAMLGQREQAMECIRKMEQRQAEDPDAVVSADMAAVWLALGDVDKVFHYLDQCIEKRLGPVGFLLEYPPFKIIKQDPRYAEIRKKAGLE